MRDFTQNGVPRPLPRGTNPVPLVTRAELMDAWERGEARICRGRVRNVKSTEKGVRWALDLLIEPQTPQKKYSNFKSSVAAWSQVRREMAPFGILIREEDDPNVVPQVIRQTLMGAIVWVRIQRVGRHASVYLLSSPHLPNEHRQRAA